jgi:predicted NBD/HSP70 family sugar kinase
MVYTASNLKDMNRRWVYELIASEKGAFRADIARRTGISGPTVLKIVDYLQECGLVEETGEGESAIGRKPQIYRFCPNRYLALGMIFEGDYIRLGIANLSGEILYSGITKTAASFEKSVSVLPLIIDRLLGEADIDTANIVGIGLGVPGCYDPERHTLSDAPLVGIPYKTDIFWVEDLLKRKYGIPITIDNDVNMEVFGEYQTIRSVCSNFVYLSLGTGIGGGIMLDGKLLRGSNYRSGEIGYMTFDENYCGADNVPGWFEQKINLRTLYSKFGFDPYSPDKSRYDEICRYLSSYLALCINNIIALLDVERITLGGIITQSLGECLISAVKNKLRTITAQDITLTGQSSADPGVSGASLRVLNLFIQKKLGE